MVIHTVREGDTIYSIARYYGVPIERIIRDNQLEFPDQLVVGQTIVILYYSRSYTVRAGDTLSSIAEMFGVSVNQLYRNNIYLRGSDKISPGDVIAIDIETDKLGSIIANGYAYPYINTDVLKNTAPYLSGLVIFSYGFTESGDLITLDEENVISEIEQYGTAPIMLLSTLTEEGVFNNNLSSVLFSSDELQDLLIDNIIETMQLKGYQGIDIDFEYVPETDAALYPAFIRKLKERLAPLGYFVMVALAPKTSREQRGLLYQGHDYKALGEAADYVLVMTYEWGYTYGPPLAVAPINEVRRVLDYAVSEISRDKILLGMPNYGYDWTLPFVQGESEADGISNVEAVNIARENNAAIRFDEVSQAPTFEYIKDGKEHVVWFEDAKSVNAKLNLINEYGLRGLSVWQIMRFFPQMWLVINSLYDIDPIE